MAEGQTATNPQTGERVILRGGQWVPLSATPQRQTQGQQQATAPRYSGAMPSNADEIFGSLIAQESGGRAGVRGPQTRYGQALGRTQVLPDTAREIARNLGIPYREDLLTGTSPEAAAYQDRLGRAYLQEGFQRTGNAREALMYYHGGPDRSLWGPKTRQYADDVLTRWSRGEGVAPQDAAFAEPQEQAQMDGSVQTATNPKTGEKLSLIDGQWVPMQQGPIEVEIDQGVQNINGRAILSGQDMGPWEEYQAGLRRSQADRIARIEREADPQYQAAMADARAGAEAVPDQLRALALGGTLGFLTDINAEAQGALQGLENAARRVSGQEIRYGADYARQAARDAMRDEQARYAAENPVENFVLQTAGGLLTPGLAQGGNYIAGAKGAARLARSGQVGAAYGAASGLGYGEGSLIERAPSVATNALVGAGVGAIGQAGVDRLVRGAANPATASAARRLSREGVELTPGQMVAEIPMVGTALRTIEEGASTIPIAGAAISGARNRSVETFNRAAINRALAPIGESLPTNLRAFTRPGRQNEAGYEAVDRASRLVSQAYDRALEGVEVRPDQQFYDDLAQVSLRIAEEAPESTVGQFSNILQNRAFRNMEFADSPITGQQFKRADSEIAALAREQRISNDPANRALARALDDTREVLRELVARQNPDKAPEIRAANQAFANLVRVQEAAGSTASQASEGVFSPTQLGVAAARGQSRGNRASGQALMQDLASSGRQVLNSRIGDSGTATRGAVTALASGAAGTTAVLNPAVAVPVIAGVSIAYSRPAQALLNAAYRATDSRAASEALQELARLAQRDPALIPYYEGAVQHVLGLFQPDTPAGQPAQPATQPPSPAIQRVLQ